MPGARLILGPLMDMDRSMDVSCGLLDRLSHPRPAFKATRTLTTVLFASAYQPAEAPGVTGGRSLALSAGSRHLWLLLPDSSAVPLALITPLPNHRQIQRLTCYDLIDGTSEQVVENDGLAAALGRAHGPALLVAG